MTGPTTGGSAHATATATRSRPPSAVLSASAVSVPEATPTAPANSVNTKAIQNGAVTTAKVGAGQIWQTQMAPAANDVYLKTYNNTVGKVQLKKEVADELQFGKSGEKITVAPKMIEFLGGPYFDPARGFTKLGEFSLEKGTWLINTAAKFHRTATGVEGTRPQIGLRIGQGTAAPNWGVDAGTIGGAEISPGNGHDLFGSTTKVITLTETTTVGVYGFGYNSDTGTAGSGQIEASAEITPVRVG